MSVQGRLPRCPYAGPDLDVDLLRRCASFAPVDAVFEVTGTGTAAPTVALAAGVSCAHLGLQPSRIEFGFVSACRHPAGPPPAATVQVVGRRLSLAEPAAEEVPAATA